jgi:hypothetical protein
MVVTLKLTVVVVVAGQVRWVLTLQLTTAVLAAQLLHHQLLDRR